MTARQIAESIIDDHEGSAFTNDPDDRGGPTKYGVTLATAKRYGLDIDGDQDVDIDDIRKLPRETAVSVFLMEYYQEPGISGLLPKMALSGLTLRASLFDQAVHSGAKRAIKMLQQLCVDCGEKIGVDGKIGPGTKRAVERLAKRDTDHLTDAYAIERRNRYLRIAQKNPSQVKYVVGRDGGKGGWVSRSESFLRSQYHLSGDEWRRVANELKGA